MPGRSTVVNPGSEPHPYCPAADDDPVSPASVSHAVRLFSIKAGLVTRRHPWQDRPGRIRDETCTRLLSQRDADSQVHESGQQHQARGFDRYMVVRLYRIVIFCVRPSDGRGPAPRRPRMLSRDAIFEPQERGTVPLSRESTGLELRRFTCPGQVRDLASAATRPASSDRFDRNLDSLPTCLQSFVGMFSPCTYCRWRHRLMPTSGRVSRSRWRRHRRIRQDVVPDPAVLPQSGPPGTGSPIRHPTSVAGFECRRGAGCLGLRWLSLLRRRRRLDWLAPAEQHITLRWRAPRAFRRSCV